MRTRRGGALVLTLAVSLGLVTLVASMAALQREMFRSSTADIERAKAKRLAMAGIERALAEAVNIDENAAGLNDEWALLGEGRGERFTIDDGSVRFQILDEGSFVGLNKAGQDQLLNLGLSTEQVDSLLDWREPGVEPRPEGAKDDYYNNLPTPYNAALAPLKTLDELLLIKGFTAPALYEPATNSQSSVVLVSGSDQQPRLSNLITVFSRAPWTRNGGQGRLNVNNATNQQLVQIGLSPQLATALIQRRNAQGPFTSLGQTLAVNGVNLQNAAALLNNLTIDASTEVTGRLNANTASEAALNSLPNSTPDVTQAILTRQQQGFTALGDLASVPGVTLQWLQANADAFVVGARAFRVRSIGEFHGRRRSVEAVVSLNNGAPRVVTLMEAPYDDMSARWEWSETTSADVPLAEAQP